MKSLLVASTPSHQNWPVTARSPVTKAAMTGLVVFCLALAASPAQAQNYSIVYSFQCGPNDGSYPAGELVADSDGNLYGTTAGGGTYGAGTIFELFANGQESVLYSFQGYPTDGENPKGSLVRDAGGNLYGTTYQGGAYSDQYRHGYGTVFELLANGSETVLHNFGASSTDGTYPWAGLARGVGGGLFGTTENGGSHGGGTIFEVSAGGKYGVAHNFGGSSHDGSDPVGGVIADAAGNLYGTTTLGGDDTCGCGIVFKLDNTGGETVLHNFEGIPDGAGPEANLLLDAAGNLYGTTDGGGDSGCYYEGGSGGSCGTVFKVTAAGEETVLYAFTGGADGGNPYLSGVVMDPNGNLYGATFQGGTFTPYDCFLDGTTDGCGVVFEVTGAGKEKVLHTFTGAPDGGMPLAGLVFSKGALYGTTNSYGANGCGTVFKITP